MCNRTVIHRAFVQKVVLKPNNRKQVQANRTKSQGPSAEDFIMNKYSITYTI